MPRKILNAKKKTFKRGLWDKSKMVAAIKAVREKEMGYKKAVKLFNVPRATLQRLARLPGTPEEVSNLKLGRKPILPMELESELVKYLLLMEKKFYGLTRNEVRMLAYQLCVQNKISNPFSHDTGLAGRGWFDHFMARHKNELSILKPSATSVSRANGFNKEAVSQFFDLLEQEIDTKHYGPNQIYNVDETGITVVQSKVAKVIGLKGKRQVGAISNAERGALVTVICCMNAEGSFVPPMLIFPRKNWTDLLMKGAPHGSIGTCHPSGWVQTNLFTDWFKHFISKTNPSESNPILLILDGHHSHTRNIELIDLARKNHVTILSIPPHTSHKLQPLDKTFMSPLKHHYSERIRQWMRHNDRSLGQYDIAELLGLAYVQCQSGLIATNGFRCTGIYPCNRDIFGDDEYAASMDNEQAGPSRLPDQQAGSSHLPDQQAGSSHLPDQQAGSSPLPDQQAGSLPLPDQQAESSPLPDQQAGSSPLPDQQAGPSRIPDQQAGPSRLPDQQAGPSRIPDQQAGPSRLPLSSISPQDLWPVPEPKRRKSNKGPKSQRSTLITGTPHRSEILRKDEKKGDKNVQLRVRKAPRKLILSAVEEEDDRVSISSGESVLNTDFGQDKPSNLDSPCLFCDGLFSQDQRGEMWVQCVQCECWAHNECAGCETDVYLCDFCK